MIRWPRSAVLTQLFRRNASEHGQTFAARASGSTNGGNSARRGMIAWKCRIGCCRRSYSSLAPPFIASSSVASKATKFPSPFASNDTESQHVFRPSPYPETAVSVPSDMQQSPQRPNPPSEPEPPPQYRVLRPSTAPVYAPRGKEHEALLFNPDPRACPPSPEAPPDSALQASAEPARAPADKEHVEAPSNSVSHADPPSTETPPCPAPAAVPTTEQSATSSVTPPAAAATQQSSASAPPESSLSIPSSLTPEPHTADLVRSCMRKTPQPVAVLVPGARFTNQERRLPEQRGGMLVSSWTTVALDPYPVVAISVRAPSATLDEIVRGGRFRLYLAGDKDAARAFARPESAVGEAGGAGAETAEAQRLERMRNRILLGLSAPWCFHCSLLDFSWEGSKVGDHHLVLGRVREVKVRAAPRWGRAGKGKQTRKALLYQNGGFVDWGNSARTQENTPASKPKQDDKVILSSSLVEQMVAELREAQTQLRQLRIDLDGKGAIGGKDHSTADQSAKLPVRHVAVPPQPKRLPLRYHTSHPSRPMEEAKQAAAHKHLLTRTHRRQELPPNIERPVRSQRAKTQAFPPSENSKDLASGSHNGTGSNKDTKRAAAPGRPSASPAPPSSVRGHADPQGSSSPRAHPSPGSSQQTRPLVRQVQLPRPSSPWRWTTWSPPRAPPSPPPDPISDLPPGYEADEPGDAPPRAATSTRKARAPDEARPLSDAQEKGLLWALKSLQGNAGDDELGSSLKSSPEAGEAGPKLSLLEQVELEMRQSQSDEEGED